MQTPEGKYKSDFSVALKGIEHLHFCIPADVFKTGFPDVLGAYRSRAFAFELKCDAKVDTAQRLELLRWKMAGAIAGVPRRHVGSNEIEWWIPVGPSTDKLMSVHQSINHFIVEFLAWCVVK